MPQRPPRRCQRCGAPIADGAPFGRIEALSIGLPGGDPAAVRWLLCGPCIAEVRALVVQRRAEEPMSLNPHGGDRVSDNAQNDQDSIGILVPTVAGGNNADYLVARIARDRPDILDRMRAGEFRSVRAAAREGTGRVDLR